MARRRVPPPYEIGPLVAMIRTEGEWRAPPSPACPLLSPAVPQTPTGTAADSDGAGAFESPQTVIKRARR